MAIRFQCPGCSQPIEVDDEHAQRLVACPYCRQTVTAPPQSTLDDADLVPSAWPLRDPASGADSGMAAAEPLAPAASGNVLAVVAFVLACAMLLMSVISSMILGAHRIEMEELAKAFEEAGGDLSGQWQAMSEFVNERGGVVPAWLLAVGFLGIASMATWLAALICGVIAVRRTARRPFAIAALVICGFYLVLSFVGSSFG